ncbi:MAG TPA: SRPBCC domain-containing protein [Terriglobales bacterium]
MPYLYTAIYINAAPTEVWSILTDFERYADWNPLLPSVQGDLRPGAPLRLQVRLPWLPLLRITTTIQQVESGISFEWAGKFLSDSVFVGLHRFVVSPNGNGQTQFEQSETYSGLFSHMVFLFLPILRYGFNQMNDSLKATAEKENTSH